MARINLLPWREELRERKNKEFLTILVLSLILGAAAAFVAWTFFNNTLENQRLANDSIVVENKKLDAKLAEIETLEQRRDEIISRMKVIQDLQGKRPLPVRVWDDVAKAIPDRMYLTEFSRSNDTFTLTGEASNPNVVATLVRNLDASDWLGNSKVVYIKQEVAAYEDASTKKSDANKDRAPYPEDSYIEFVVTTDVQVSKAEDQDLSDNEGASANENNVQESSPESQTNVGDA